MAFVETLFTQHMQPLHSRFMYLLQHGQCSWMDMHQFLGDLITSGNPSKNTPDVLNAAWGVAGVGGGGGSGGSGVADAALGFKATSLEPLRPVQEKTAAGSSQRNRESRDRREGRSSVNTDFTQCSCKKNENITDVICLSFSFRCPSCLHLPWLPLLQFSSFV